MKKHILIVLLIWQFIILSACGNKQIGELVLPDRADVVSAIFVCGDETGTITDGEIIDDLFNELSSITIKSGESYDDTPRTEDYLKIVFETSEGLSSDIVYVFKEGSKFFVEQPYHGIFAIDGTKYGTICSMLILS